MGQTRRTSGLRHDLQKGSGSDPERRRGPSIITIWEETRMNGKGVPRIIDTFAAKGISPGKTWKIYLRAEDAHGDMKYIICTLDQAGAGVYPVSLIKIPADQQRSLCGYIYLNTGGVKRLDFLSLMLTINIQDGAGNYSDPVLLPLNLDPRAEEEHPPMGLFEDRDLGPIMINLTFQASDS